MGAASELPLRGRTIVTTRDQPGALDALLVELGATVVHMPLIEIVEAADGGAALADALARIDTFDWIVVTSRHGAERVADAARESSVRLAAVGTATATVLAERSGRPVELVPNVQLATALVEAFPDGPWSVLVAQADRAADTIVAGLRRRGCDVVVCTAYSSRLRMPSTAELASALGADAVAFASGSAVEAWVEAIGTRTPPIVCVIGPTTESAATRSSLKVSAVAADHTVQGLARVLTELLVGDS
ncbi:MAG TPA: uroporphyrinogen-III synthase [Ilumatobacteraceae bacterium]|nr:uroporphyrinogen-III synthase [Ilumatobacteraceae bacterium]